MKWTIAMMVLGTLASGCGGDDGSDDPFDTYQECFDDLTLRDGRPVLDTIVECCLTHPIGGVRRVCQQTGPDCINYLTANLSQNDASPGQVRDACAIYVEMLPE